MIRKKDRLVESALEKFLSQTLEFMTDYCRYVSSRPCSFFWYLMHDIKWRHR